MDMVVFDVIEDDPNSEGRPSNPIPDTIKVVGHGVCFPEGPVVVCWAKDTWGGKVSHYRDMCACLTDLSHVELSAVRVFVADRKRIAHLLVNEAQDELENAVVDARPRTNAGQWWLEKQALLDLLRPHKICGEQSLTDVGPSVGTRMEELRRR